MWFNFLVEIDLFTKRHIFTIVKNLLSWRQMVQRNFHAWCSKCLILLDAQLKFYPQKIFIFYVYYVISFHFKYIRSLYLMHLIQESVVVITCCKQRKMNVVKGRLGWFKLTIKFQVPWFLVLLKLFAWYRIYSNLYQRFHLIICTHVFLQCVFCD